MAYFCVESFCSMKKIFLILLTAVALSLHAEAQTTYNSSGSRSNSYAQKKKAAAKGFDPHRLIFGGGLSLSFGDYTSIGVSPIIGYKFTDHFAAGVGIGYQYLRIKNYVPLTDLNGFVQYYDYKSSIVYPSVWARYIVFSNFFVQAELEHDFQGYTDYRFDQNGTWHDRVFPAEIR